MPNPTNEFLEWLFITLPLHVTFSILKSSFNPFILWFIQPQLWKKIKSKESKHLFPTYINEGTFSKVSEAAEELREVGP